MADELSERDRRLQKVLGDFLERLEQGQQPDRNALLAQHPDLAGDLQSFFVENEKMRRLAGQPQDDTLGFQDPNFVPGTGTKLRYLGDYELLEEIARGGMGIVFRAKQVSLGREVAIKMILRGEFATATDVRRFHTEAEAAAHLDHPNIVPIYEVGEFQGLHYFSMKLIEGSRLRSPFQADHPSRERQRAAARIVALVARAVQYAHERGILHRDLKPANILLDVQGQPHVTDFGLAKRTAPRDGTHEPVTDSGAIVGTASYMAPEQAQGAKDLTVAADIYSLGAVFYDLLAGRPPFQGDDHLSVLLKLVAEEPTPLRSIQNDIDRDLETICLKCLEKDPAKRYGSAGLFAEDLESWLAGEPIQARPAGSAERVWRWCRRNPVVAGLTAALLLALVVGFVSTLLLWQEAEGNAESARAEAKRAEEALVELRNQEEQTRHALERESGLLYANRLALAQNEWRTQQLAAAERTLLQCPPERRGWEWHYLRKLCHPELLNLEDSGLVVAYSPDGKYLATAVPAHSNGDDLIRLLDQQTGKSIIHLRGHTSKITKLSFSADGRRLASAHGYEHSSSKGEAKVWDLETHKELLSLSSPSGYKTIALSSDGSRLAYTDRQGNVAVRVHDIALKKDVLTIPSRGNVVAFSPNGKLLATASGNNVEIWDAVKGARLHACEPLGLDTEGLAFSPDSLDLAVAGVHFETHRGGVAIFNAGDGEKRLTFSGHAGPVTCVAYSFDGKRIASGGTGSLKIWSAEDGQELLNFPVEATSELTYVSFRPDGRQLATSSRYDASFWDAIGRVEHRDLPHAVHDPRDLLFSQDGTHAFTMDNWGRRVKSWNVGTGAQLLEYPFPYREKGQLQGKFDRIALREDGTLLALVLRLGKEPKTFALEVHDLNAGTVLFTPAPKVERDYISNASLPGAAFSRDAKYVAVPDGDEPTTLAIWDTALGQRAWKSPRGAYNGELETQRFGDVRFAADGQRLLVIRARKDDHILRTNQVADATIFDWKAGRTVLADVPVYQARLSPDGSHFAASDEVGALSVWDAMSGAKRFTIPKRAAALAFTNDGRRLATNLGIWDVETGLRRCAMELPMHVHAAFTEDGSRLVTAMDQTLEVWDAEKGHHLLSLVRTAKSQYGHLFGPKERWLISLEDDVVRMYDGKK